MGKAKPKKAAPAKKVEAEEMVNGLTRDELVTIATDLNEVMDFEDPIPTDEDRDLQELYDEINDVMEDLSDNDELADETWDLLAKGDLYERAEEPAEEPEPAPKGKKTVAKEKPAKDEAPKEKKKSNLPPKKNKLSRIQCFAAAVQEGITSIDGINDRANEIFVENGGGDNIKEMRSVAKTYYYPLLVAMGVATMTEDTFTMIGAEPAPAKPAAKKKK